MSDFFGDSNFFPKPQIFLDWKIFLGPKFLFELKFFLNPFFVIFLTRKYQVCHFQSSKFLAASWDIIMWCWKACTDIQIFTLKSTKNIRYRYNLVNRGLLLDLYTSAIFHFPLQPINMSHNFFIWILPTQWYLSHTNSKHILLMSGIYYTHHNILDASFNHP